MTTLVNIVAVRGLCKFIGSLGGVYVWNDENRHDTEANLFIHLRDEDQIRLVELIQHPELLRTERAYGKVDSHQLAKLCTTEYTPVQLLQLCAQVLHERVGSVDTTELPEPRYRKHIDERDEQLVQVIGRFDSRLQRVEAVTVMKMNDGPN